MVDKDIQLICFPASGIIPNKEIPGDLYLFVNGHFVKYKNRGDTVSAEKLDYFLTQKMQYIFIHLNDLDQYKKWSKEKVASQIETIVKATGEEARDLVIKGQEIRETLFNFMTTDVSDKSIKEIMDKTRNYVETIKGKAGADRFLARILSFDRTLHDHSTNVANLAVFLGLNCGYSQQIILENLYNGALLHDFGKTRVSRHFEDPNSKEAIMSMRKHPEVGRTALLLDSGFPDEVLRIIAEHHERNDGKGYPKGLKGSKIYELTKIVSIANYIDNELMEGPEANLAAKKSRILKDLEEDHGKVFDSKILGKCIRALETIFNS